VRFATVSYRSNRFEVHHRRRAVVAEPQTLGILKKKRASFLEFS